MKKHFSRALALLLALAMVISVLPVMALAVDEGTAASFVNGLPEDNSYGVLFNADGYVMGADIADGKAPAKTAATEGNGIKSLPNGTAIVKFIKTGSDYYMTLGGKYLTVKDEGSAKEQLVLTESVETGSKWSFIADKAGKAGWYNIKNAEYKYNGTSDVYLEQYRGTQISPYSYYATDKNGNDTTSLYQFKFAATEADEDGRVGEVVEAGGLPVNGGKYVVYNHSAKAVMGQPTGADVAAPALQAAAATVKNDALAYEDVADGGLIFTVSVESAGSETHYVFENNGKYLAMPENTVDENGKTNNDETLLLIDSLTDYAKWTLTEVSGGYVMYNVAARYGTSKCCVEFFNDVFSGWTYKSSTPELFAMKFYPMEDKDGAGYVVNPWVELKTPEPAIGSDCPVEFEIHDVSDPVEVVANYMVTDRNDTPQTPKQAEPEIVVRKGSFTIPAADLENGKAVAIDISVKDALGKDLRVVRTFTIQDEPLILTNSPAANSATGDETRPEISVTYANVGANPSFEMLLDGQKVAAAAAEGKLAYTPAQELGQGKHTVSVTITRADGKSVTKEWSFFVGAGGETLYFGQIHAHTAEYSDGAGTLEDAYEHAQGVDDMDFIIITDHSNYFDTTSTATTSSYYDLSPLLKNAAGTTTKWEEARATAKEYNEKYDNFLCVYGYEMTWSGGPGHTNSFNTYGVVSRNNKELNNKTGYAGMHRYNDLMVNADKGLNIEDKEAKTTRDGAEVTGVNATKYIPFDEAGNAVPVVSQFNHPGKTFGNFDNYAGYSAKRDDVLNLIEVGNGEGKVGGSSYFPSYAEYDLCLSMGWHVGPTNNQDNHKGAWGDSNTCRDVILTDDFSEIGLYRALDQRRIYATEDQNLEIYYELEANGVRYKLGDIAPIDENAQPEKVTVHLTVNEPDRENIKSVEVIGEGGKSLKKIDVNAQSYKGEIELDNTDGYYYIRVVEADGQIAVTAPVWVKEAVPVAADLETSASVAAQGEEETIKATLTNGSETEALTLTGYKVEAEGRVLEEKTGLSETVAPGSEKVLELPFTPSLTNPSEKKTYDITVTFTVVYKEKELSYTKTISETSYPPELMTYIGVDRGHKNFYISGDYANNDGSFIEICAERGIIAQYIDEGQMTKENLKKYKALVLTVPRINDSTQPPAWTADELEALADYTANGGSIINLSKSDRYDYTELGSDGKDTYNYASATLSNLVNEAIGAKARFVRGIVVDNDRKSNEAYRINFTGKELLGDHLFTQGIFASSNGQYQWYNGTGITGGEGVTTLVAPYDSSWVACYKDNFTGSSYVPDYEKDTVMAKKGEFSLVTYEDLAGGGFLVCAGACFISNYDLKFGTPASQQYENYGLVCNILDYIKDGKNEETITPIAQVHKGQVGQEFTIEGWVTSNASDYDKDTAFFDCIYIQDETRGINAFPVAGYYYIGEQVRAHGGVTYYCGEIELNLGTDYNGSIQVISNDLNVLEPKTVSCKDAMSDDNIGNLLKVSGVITDIHKTAGVIDKIYVDDGSGEEAMFFINAYIQKESTVLDHAQVGMAIEGIGIGSRDVDEASGGADGQIGDDIDPSLYIKRLRVRSRDELRVWADPCIKFTDIDRKSWYHESVDYVLEAGLMNGTGETTFAPDGALTRSMIVTVLHRMAETPAPTGANPFNDVENDSWYTDAVLWAAETGITKGTGNNNFSPNVVVTREQEVTFLYRFAAYMGYDVSGSAALDSYPDQGDTGSYAVEAMQWAVSAGLINGIPENDKLYLKPLKTITRAELATILMRFAKTDLANKNDIVILYTNDVHCGIDNSTSSFGYAGLAAYKAEMEDFYTSSHVGLVDAGDFIQGEAIGSLTKGDKIVDIMNRVGYQAVTLGNHEFDYGVDNILSLVKKADFEVVTSNWIYTGPAGAADAVDLEGYTLVDYDGVKIAYVGITTPESLVKSTPTYFQDAEGNWIYDFCNDESGEALYAAVQTEVDAAKEAGADYVVALAHLGVDAGSAPWRSTDVIANTTGIDVMLDGHSHSVIPGESVNNKDGEAVLLSSTGTKLANIGKLTISAEGELSTELIARADYDGKDAEVEAYISEIKAAFAELLQQVVVEGLSKDLTISNPNRLDASGNPVRAVRYQETNLGDVCADAYVYAGQGVGADIAFVNGGGVRANIKAGDVTYENIIAVHPFGNELVVVEATGQQILDALEMASRNTTINADGLVDGECGGFLQVSGLKYTIYTGTPSTVSVDTAGMFESVTGQRRVGNVQVLNKTSGQYEPIDPAKTYTLASHNYMLKEGGDGLNMFMKDKILQDGGKLDNEVLIDYFNSELFAQRLSQGLYDSWDGNCARITVSPEAAPEGGQEPDEGTQYALTTTLAQGDKVVIYHPASGQSTTDTLSGKKIAGVEVTVADGLLTPAETTAVYTVEYVDETNFLLKNAGGKYLTSAPTGNGMSLEETANEYSQWYLQVLDEAAGTVGIRSTNAAYNNTKNQALEYFSGFTTYGWKDNNDAYIFQLYKETPVEYAYQLRTALAADDKLVIYHPASGQSTTDTLDGKKIAGVAVTVAEGLLTPAETTAVYTVEYVDETNFLLKNAEGKYLTSAPTGNGMSLEETANEYSQWYLQILDEAAGTVGIRSTNAAYNNNKNQALEYFSGFTTYGWKDNNDAYIFQLYVYGELQAAPPVPEVNTAALEAAIAAAQAVDTSLYTPETVAALNTALQAAQAVLAREDKTQAEVNEAAAALQAAIDGLIRLDAELYAPAAQLQTGDEVVLYNAGNGKAVKAEMTGFYIAGADVTPSEGVIADPDASIVWTVTVNEDGSYTFRQGTNVLAVGQSVKDAEAGTYYTNLYLTEEDHVINWNPAVCNEANKSFTLYADGLHVSYEHIYLEWYSGKFSAYDTSAERATEQNFGFQFYVKGAEPGTDPDPDPDPDPSDPVYYEKVTEAPADWSGSYILVYSEDGASGKVFNGTDAANGGSYTTVSIEDGVITSSEALFTVSFEAMEGGYAVKTANGYMGNTTSGNSVTTSSETQLLNELSFSENGLQLKSNEKYFRFNPNANNDRFRYFKDNANNNSMPIPDLYVLVNPAG